MNEIAALVRDLVVANRILASENVVDAYGHVSVRHPGNPQRFLLATSVAPEMVEEDHIVEFNLDCTPVRDDGRPLYHERFIHGGIYEARPDVQAVVHAHSEDVLPFSTTVSERETKVFGANAVGLERRGFSPEVIDALHKALRLLTRAGLNTSQAIERIAAEVAPAPEIAELLEFIAASERGFVK